MKKINFKFDLKFLVVALVETAFFIAFLYVGSYFVFVSASSYRYLYLIICAVIFFVVFKILKKLFFVFMAKVFDKRPI